MKIYMHIFAMTEKPGSLTTSPQYNQHDVSGVFWYHSYHATEAANFIWVKWEIDQCADDREIENE